MNKRKLQNRNNENKLINILIINLIIKNKIIIQVERKLKLMFGIGEIVNNKILRKLVYKNKEKKLILCRNMVRNNKNKITVKQVGNTGYKDFRRICNFRMKIMIMIIINLNM